MKIKSNKKKLNRTNFKSATISQLKRERQKKALKEEEAELMKELNMNKQGVKDKLPRVHGKGKDFEICARGVCKHCRTKYGRGDKGAKPSLLQKVVFLREFVESTREMRKQIYEAMEAEKQKENENENQTESSASLFQT